MDTKLLKDLANVQLPVFSSMDFVLLTYMYVPTGVHVVVNFEQLMLPNGFLLYC